LFHNLKANGWVTSVTRAFVEGAHGNLTVTLACRGVGFFLGRLLQKRAGLAVVLVLLLKFRVGQDRASDQSGEKYSSVEFIRVESIEKIRKEDRLAKYSCAKNVAGLVRRDPWKRSHDARMTNP